MLVANITVVVVEIIFKEDVITSSVPNISHIVVEISGCGYFFSGKDHFCSEWDNI